LRMATAEYPPSMWNDYAINSLTLTHKPFVDQKRMKTLIEEIRNIFHSMEDRKTSPSAYDTAWIARIPAIDNPSQPQFPQTLKWVVCNQLADGSWEEESFYFPYDRLVSTLSCVITLRIWKVVETQVQKGIDFVNKQIQRLDGEECKMPSGFVTHFSSLLKEAHTLGLGIYEEVPLVKRVLTMGDTELKGDNQPSYFLSPLEGSQELIDWKQIRKLCSKDGSIPGSSAFAARVFMHTGDTKCLDFINSLLGIFGDYAPCFYLVDLRERLFIIDNLQNLGIDRYFKKEINHALNYVYRFWNHGDIEKGSYDTIANVNDISMGFRILRLHGYTVSPEVFNNFRDEKGEFFSFADKTHREAEDMLNLCKCSQIAFSGETIMKDAETFTKHYLQNLHNTKHYFSRNVEYVLKYGFHRNLPRLETRFYIEHFGVANDAWSTKTSFRWWIDSGFRMLNFTRERHIEIYFAVAAGMFEPEYGDCRMAFTKIGCLLVVLDDLYDKYTSHEDIMLFNESFNRWDLNKLDQIPEHIKICFMGLYNTVDELGKQASKVQGHDMLQYFQKLWKVQLEAFTKEVEWSKHKYVPTWDEYIDVAKVSGGFGTTLLTSIHVMGEVINDDILRKIDHRSKALHLVCLTTRLINDTKTFKDERECGELASAIECYMKDNVGVSEEEALGHVYNVIEEGLVELNKELFMANQVPDVFRKLLLNSARLSQLFYMQVDAFNSSNLDKKEMVEK
ncbi:hypothetical protein KI387_015647, partial [Taxus chinensis]